VDRAPQAQIPLGIDEEDGDEEQRPGEGVERLPGQGRPARVVRGDAVDRPEAVRDDADVSEQQEPVEPAQPLGDADRLCLPAGAEAARALVDCLERHQSEAWLVIVADVWKYCSNTFRAAGAAAVPPWPPFSITAQTTICGESNGPYPHHHDCVRFCEVG